MEFQETDDNLSMGSGWSYGPWARDKTTEEPETGRDLLPMELRSPYPAADGGMVGPVNSTEDTTDSPLYAGCDWEEFLEPTIQAGDVNDLGRDIVRAYLDDPLQDLQEIAEELDCEEELVHTMLAKGTRSDQYTQDTLEPEVEPEAEPESSDTIEAPAYEQLNDNQQHAIDVTIKNPDMSFQECSRASGNGKTFVSTLRSRVPEAFCQRAKALDASGEIDGVPAHIDALMAQTETKPTSTESTQRTKTFEDLPDSQQEAITEFFLSPDRTLLEISEGLDHDQSYLSSLRSKKEWAFEERLEQLLEDPEIDNSEIRAGVWDSSRRTNDDTDESADPSDDTTEDTMEQELPHDEDDPSTIAADTFAIETEDMSMQDSALESHLDVALESVSETIQSGQIDDPEEERLLLDNYRILIDLVDAKRRLATPAIGEE